jgi:hypothetical protein
MKQLTIIIFLFLIFTGREIYSCNSCGGGTGDLAVLSLDGLALFNVGVSRDVYTGVWDKDGKWIKNNHSQSQNRILTNAAYRLNRHIQFAVSLPFVYNTSSIPGLKQNGAGIGDLTIGGRYEIFHEFQPKKEGKKLRLDRTLPYAAVTFGFTLPTGTSDETAENDVDITGKGFYTSSLTKTIIRSRLQLLGDFAWQHSFKKKYDKYFGEPVNSDFRKQPGDKYNYSLSVNYIINNWHAVTLTASGFIQNNYRINDVEGINSNERSNNLILSYTYYPSVPFRITTSFKTGLPGDDLGVNAQGSTGFNISFTYYIPQ